MVMQKSPLRHKVFFYIARRMGYFVSTKTLPKQFILTKVTDFNE